MHTFCGKLLNSSIRARVSSITFQDVSQSRLTDHLYGTQTGELCVINVAFGLCQNIRLRFLVSWCRH